MSVGMVQEVTGFHMERFRGGGGEQHSHFSDSFSDSGEVILEGGEFFGSQTFSPKEIVIQILVIQTAYYSSLSGLIFVAFSLLGLPRYPGLLFSPTYLTWAAYPGSCVLSIIVVFLAIGTAFFIAAVVERTRKCFDFTLTLHLIHCFVCYYVEGFKDAGWSFWILQSLCVIITTLLSERLCMKAELQDIVLQKKGGNSNKSSSRPPVGNAAIRTSARARPSIQNILRPRVENTFVPSSTTYLNIGSQSDPPPQNSSASAIELGSITSHATAPTAVPSAASSASARIDTSPSTPPLLPTNESNRIYDRERTPLTSSPFDDFSMVSS